MIKYQFLAKYRFLFLGASLKNKIGHTWYVSDQKRDLAPGTPGECLEHRRSPSVREQPTRRVSGLRLFLFSFPSQHTALISP